MDEGAKGQCSNSVSSGRWPLVAMMAIVTALSCNGCIWLAIPSLAYEGYKYDKTGSLTGTSSSGSSSSSPNSQNSGSNNSNSPSNSSQDHSIE